MTDYPKDRAEAKRLGATHYFTGLPCKRGHIALRKTKGACIECLKEDWVKDGERRQDYFRAYNQSERGVQVKRQYYERSVAIVKERAADWAQQNPEKRKSVSQKWKKENLDSIRVHTAQRKRRFYAATPKWLTAQQKQEIKAIYAAARLMTKTTGIKYTVDHHVPLKHNLVCGLHVPWNLKLLSHIENASKHNKFDVE